jgi:2-aminoethylphosphonate-pyruvate transaminase
MTRQRMVLLNPGPVNVSDAVRAAIAGPDWCHRESEAFDLVDDVRALILDVLGLDRTYSAVLLGGSGTAAVEAMVTSCVPAGKYLLVVRNGVYGERMIQMARAHAIGVLDVEAAWTERPDPAGVDRMLSEHPEVGAIALVHHETTTGLLNDVAAIGAVARAHRVRFLLDTVSGLAGDPLDLVQAHVDAAACTANKCIQGLPGVAFVVARRNMLEEEAQPVRSVYLHLPAYHDRQEARDTPFTPPLQVLMALRQALHELSAETIAGRIARYRGYAARLREGFQALGLTLLLPAALRSSTITTVCLPEGCTYERLHAALKSEGFVIYAGQGSLRARSFRIANMGNLSYDDIDGCLDVLKRALGAS